MLSFSHRDGTVEVAYNYVKLFVHGERRPLIVLRKARESVEMYRGNFFIEDEILEESRSPNASGAKSSSGASTIP